MRGGIIASLIGGGAIAAFVHQALAQQGTIAISSPSWSTYGSANRDDLFSVTSLKHYPYVAISDFHRPKHLYS